MVKRIKLSASLTRATPNNCFAVYQKELTLLLIQAESPLTAYCNRPLGTYLIRLKKAVTKKVI